jgi:hypothetical protein
MQSQFRIKLKKLIRLNSWTEQDNELEKIILHKPKSSPKLSCKK